MHRCASLDPSLPPKSNYDYGFDGSKNIHVFFYNIKYLNLFFTEPLSWSDLASKFLLHIGRLGSCNLLDSIMPHFLVFLMFSSVCW